MVVLGVFVSIFCFLRQIFAISSNFCLPNAGIAVCATTPGNINHYINFFPFYVKGEEKKIFLSLKGLKTFMKMSV
jgi:hypothetical protein